MKINLTLILTLFISTSLFAQKTDTLNFYSKAFEKERTIYITTPEFYKYQSNEVKLPVIYILDGQHEWLVNPLKSTIEYLQYTHHIPAAIIVTIPTINRFKEFGIIGLGENELPLHKFITHEVDEKIQKYNPSKYKIIIGHSFSASFALYSYLKSPNYYSAVIANTLSDSFKELILAFEADKQIDKSRISISVGGISESEDFYHRTPFDALKSEFPDFFNSITTFIADKSKHNAVPIVANPYLLTKVFSVFKDRFVEITKKNYEFKLKNKPISVNEELTKIESASKIGAYFYPPEIPELNEMASLYKNEGLNEYAIAIYELAKKYYPNHYYFHYQLYKLNSPINIESSKVHLNKAYELLNTFENDFLGKQEELNDIATEKKKNGW